MDDLPPRGSGRSVYQGRIQPQPDRLLLHGNTHAPKRWQRPFSRALTPRRKSPCRPVCVAVAPLNASSPLCACWRPMASIPRPRKGDGSGMAAPRLSRRSPRRSRPSTTTAVSFSTRTSSCSSPSWTARGGSIHAQESHHAGSGPRIAVWCGAGICHQARGRVRQHDLGHALRTVPGHSAMHLPLGQGAFGHPRSHGQGPGKRGYEHDQAGSVRKHLRFAPRLHPVGGRTLRRDAQDHPRRHRRTYRLQEHPSARRRRSALP